MTAGPKRWILDTSVLIDHLRDVPLATELLRGAARDGVRICSVTIVRTELLAGMRPREERSTKHLFDVLEWFDVTKEIADQAGAFIRRYSRSHQTIDVSDYLIAAAARCTGAQLVTLNVKHFPMFPGLQAPYTLPVRRS